MMSYFRFAAGLDYLSSCCGTAWDWTTQAREREREREKERERK